MLSKVRTSEVVSKSVLLEIAKETDPVRQADLWAQAQAGQTSVSKLKAERRKKSPTAARLKVWKLVLDDATVVVRFRRGEATPERVTAALERALAELPKPEVTPG